MGGRPDHDRRGEGLIRLLPPDPEGIEAAVEALAEGRLVLHPTETVVSLTGDPYRNDAVTAARRVKGYETPRPFLCLVGGAEAARSLAAEWPETARRLAEAFWPGPLTLIVPASDRAPAPVVDAGRLALRPAGDPVSRRLLAAWDGPLFSTSANLKGEPPALHVNEAARALAAAPGAEAIEIGLLEAAGGPADTEAAGEPSTILDVSTSPPRVVRIGAIPLDRIHEVVPVAGGSVAPSGGAVELLHMSRSRPYRVLVVCTGNTCRSPMAEALLRRLFERAGIDGEVRSAGTAPMTGGPAHPHSVATASARGLDLSEHVARPLSPEVLRWADTVLAMQRGHARAVREMDSTGDVHVVTEFLPDGDREGILDPIGREREVYEEVFDEMRTALEAFVESRSSSSSSPS